MPIQVTCPGCGQVITAPDDWAGKHVRCHNCQAQHTVPSPNSAESHQPADADVLPTYGSDPPARALPSRSFQGILDQVFEGMGQALSVRKLSFFLLSTIAAFVAWGLLVRIGFAIGTVTGLGMMFIANSMAIGLSGVIAGGVAYLTVEEGQGRACRLMDAVTFCGQRFVTLFFGAILLVMGVGLVGGLVNGLVALLNQSRTVGSLLGSLLFLPQVAVNAALVVLCLVGVLVPCAVVVERMGPIRAIQRLVSLLVQRPGGLLLQFGITLYFGVMMLCVLAVLAIVSLAPTFATNGPSLAGMIPSFPSLDAGEADLSGLLSDEDLEGLGLPGIEVGQFPSISPGRSRPELTAPRGPWGDWLRELGTGVVFIAVLAFPVVFWICAFARYYESLVATFPTPAPETTTSPIPPPLPAPKGGSV